MKSIAIVGAGFSGAMAAVHLLSQDKVQCKVILYDSSAKHSRGIAYGVESSAFLLNVPAATMSAFPDDPEHFFNWIKKKKLPYQGSDFVPRKLYGDYLEEILDDVAVTSCRLERKSCLVDNIEKSGETWTVKSSSGENQVVDAIILAIGFARQEFQYLNPHLQSSYDDIEDCKKIVLIGSGLTAVDVLEECRAREYGGEIVVLSTSAKFPYLHKEISNLQEKLGFLELISLPHVSLRQMLKCLRQDIIKHGADRVMHDLRPYISALWGKLSTPDKKIFYRRLESRWNRVRHRMPQSSADNIENLKNRGKLNIIKGKFEESKTTTEVKQKIYYKDRSGLNSFEADKVFDCRGPSGWAKAHPLLGRLIDEGMVKLTELNRGILTDANGNAATQGSPALFILGPLRREALLESTAVRELRQQAVDISAAVIEGLGF